MYLVPVTQYQVHYQCSSRRQYFELDRLLLRSVAEGGKRSFRDLEEELRLPRRMLIEAIVSLFEDGWLALRYDECGGPLELTAKARALKVGDLWNWKRFEAPRLPESKTQLVLLDRVTGGLARKEDVHTVSRRQLEEDGFWELVKELPKEVGDTHLDEGRLRRVLRPARDQWIYSIQPADPHRHYYGDFYVPVDIDGENRALLGRMPHEWKHRLKGVALAYARQYAPLGTWNLSAERIRSLDTRSEFTYSISVIPEDILLSSDQRQAALQNLFVRAQRGDSILLASSGIHPGFFSQGNRDSLRLALQREVHVDIFWDDVGSDTDRIRRFQEQLSDLVAGSAPNRSFLRYNHRSVPIAFHLAILASPFRTPEALFSNTSWFVPGDPAERALALRIRFVRMISEAGYTISTVFARCNHVDMEASRHRWRELASILESNAFEAGEHSAIEEADAWRCAARLVREADFAEEWNQLAQLSASRSLLVAPSVDDEFKVLVKAWADSRPSSEGEHQIVLPRQGDQTAGGFLALADDGLLLANPIAQSDARKQHSSPLGLGILVYGAELCDQVWSRFRLPLP